MVIGKSSVFNRKLSPIQYVHLFLWLIFHSYVSLEESFGAAQKATFNNSYFPQQCSSSPGNSKKNCSNIPRWGPMVTTWWQPGDHWNGLHQVVTIGPHMFWMMDQWWQPGAIHSGNCRRQIPEIWCPYTTSIRSPQSCFSIFRRAPSQVTENSWTLWECPRILYLGKSSINGSFSIPMFEDTGGSFLPSGEFLRHAWRPCGKLLF